LGQGETQGEDGPNAALRQEHTMSRKRRPRSPGRKPSERREDYAAKFRQALVSSMSLEEIITAAKAELGTEAIQDLLGRPFYVCNRAADSIGVWTLAGEFARACGVPPGKTRVMLYRICRRCGVKAAQGDQWTQDLIEAKVMAYVRGDGMVAFGPGGRPIVEPVPFA
jgi:hypothetical protein